MVTKGIVTNIQQQTYKDITYYLYQVRLPLFHGYNSADATPDSELPWAGACLPPKMYQSTYSVGDLVYVTIEDLDSSYPLIIGMAPVSQIDNLNGSAQSDSNLAMENVTNLTTRPDGAVVLPHDILIRADADIETYKNEKFKDTQNTPYVTGAHLANVRGAEAPLQEQIYSTNQKLTEAFNTIMNVNITSDLPGSQLQIDINRWFDSGRFPAVADNSTYTFTYKDIGPGQFECGDIYYRNLDDFKSIGMNFSSSYNPFAQKKNITITVHQGAIKLQAGGTGASTAAEARNNLGVLQSVLVPVNKWESMQDSNLEVNTIYYIYSET